MRITEEQLEQELRDMAKEAEELLKSTPPDERAQEAEALAAYDKAYAEYRRLGCNVQQSQEAGMEAYGKAWFPPDGVLPKELIEQLWEHRPDLMEAFEEYVDNKKDN